VLRGARAGSPLLESPRGSNRARTRRQDPGLLPAGSLLGSLLVGRLRGVDIREQGSGNAGGTNALRTQGWGFALA